MLRSYNQYKMTRPFSILAAIFLILISASIYSQTTDSLKAKQVIISTSVTDYFPAIKLNTGNFNVGTEIYLKNGESVYANFGLIKSYQPPRGMLSISSLSTQGIKIQIEGRHYLNLHKIFGPAILLFWPHVFQYNSQPLQNTGYYLAVHSFFQRTATDRQETALDYIDNNPFPNSTHYRENIYTVHRSVYALNIKFGYQCIKNCGLTIDYAVGIGALFIASHSANRIGAGADRTNGDRDYPSNKLFNQGTGFSPNGVYQIRLGWSL
jgi:hypothetical protein